MKLQVIVGSTRPGRITERIAKWVNQTANQLPDIDSELVDLADFPMPMLDEPVSPQFNPDRNPNQPAKQWLDKLAEADAYVLVTPEYNRSTSGVLKNALDYVDYQLQRKPVALVGHGSTGGAQAISHLRGILPGLLAVSVPPATFLIGPVKEFINEDGHLSQEKQDDSYGPAGALKRTLDETIWYANALKAARES